MTPTECENRLCVAPGKEYCESTAEFVSTVGQMDDPKLVLTNIKRDGCVYRM